MACRIASRSSSVRVAAISVSGAAAFLAFDAAAQTLTHPNPPAKWPPPQAAAKSNPAPPVKSCSAYGAGFVNVPGTDACIKIGGWVTVEGTAGR